MHFTFEHGQRWSRSNTVHLDDLARNFSMNMQSGLKVRAFDRKKPGADQDRELLEISKYLAHLANQGTDFATVDHSNWEEYLATQKHKLPGSGTKNKKQKGPPDD